MTQYEKVIQKPSRLDITS